MQFSKDGKLAVTAGFRDNTAILWDMGTRRELRRFYGHVERILSVSISDDRKRLATSSQDGTIAVWDLETGTELVTLGVRQTLNRPKVSLFGQGEARRQLLNSLPEHVSFLPGSRLLVASIGPQLSVFDVDSNSDQPLRSARDSRIRIRAIDVSEDGSLILTVHDDRAVRLWDANSLEARGATGRRLHVTAARFCGRADRIAVGTQEGQLALWSRGDNPEPEILGVLPSIDPPGKVGDEPSNFIGAVACAAKAGLVAAVSQTQGVAAAWDLNTLAAVTIPEDNLRRANYAPVVEAANGGQDLVFALHTVGGMHWIPQGNRATPLFDVTAVIPRAAAWSTQGTLIVGLEDGSATVWNSEIESIERLSGHKGTVSGVTFLGREHFVATGSHDGSLRVWDRATGAVLGQADVGGSIQRLSEAPADGGFVVGSLPTREGASGAAIWTASSSGLQESMVLTRAPVLSVATSQDGRWIALGRQDRIAELRDGTSGEMLSYLVCDDWVTDVAVSNDAVLIAACRDGTTTLSNPQRTLRRRWDGQWGITRIALSPDQTQLAIADAGGAIQLIDLRNPGAPPRVVTSKDTWDIEAISYSSNGGYLLSVHADGRTRVRDVSTCETLAQLVSRRDGNVIVTGPNGTFDIQDMRDAGEISWVFRDEPLRPLPLELFMRDYYEPKLLGRLFAGERFQDTRPPAALNRVQPIVEIKSATWLDERARIARVTVHVERNKASNPQMGDRNSARTNVFDLRLFRDGQLVAWAPKNGPDWQLKRPTDAKDTETDDRRWRQKTQVGLRRNGTQELEFTVQVPRRKSLQDVTFTAYAFNKDRVKSATSPKKLSPKAPANVRAPKAYVIALGVNTTQSTPNWDLRYAVRDARNVSRVLKQKLDETGQYGDVVALKLVADKEGPYATDELPATKKHLKAVLDVLAGRSSGDERLRKATGDKLEKAQPEDLVVLAISSHGFTDARGVFHMVLADIGEGQRSDRITPALLRRTLSSDQLTVWLRDIDAGDIAMIIDACHSEASVAYDGFRPGPMGSRGLGQLAYDKGMRILAASREVALEAAGDIQQGLLSHALVHKGLELGGADLRQQDGKILLSEWLSFGVHEVPRSYSAGAQADATIGSLRETRTDDIFVYLGPDAPRGYQQPVLFDYGQGSADRLIAITRNQAN